MLLLADLPGVTGDSLDLRVERNRLTIRGRIPATPEGARKHLDETWEGDFFREFQISEDLDAGDVRATLEHGVLRLEIPKSKKLQSRRIEIRTK
jgi:HSP20 family protein